MKHILKKSALLWLCWLVTFTIATFVKADTLLTITPDDLFKDYLQKVRFHTLLLWSWEEAPLQVSTDNNKLNIWNWMVVWKNSNVSNNSSSYVIIGWWEGNSINGDASYGGIGWWRNNKTRYESTVIGGWVSNSATWKNAVILGWDFNKASAWGVVVWWKMNTSDEWWVVLWWNSNTASKNGLALWQNAVWSDWWFGWNGYASNNSAYINAKNWALIGTYSKKEGVNVVVNGAVQVKWRTDLWDNATKWEIRWVDGCFYVYDGSRWHFINKWDPSKRCKKDSLANSCGFGNTVVQEWDKLGAYSHSYAPTNGYTRCVEVQIECRHDGHLYTTTGGVLADGYYTYCYDMP